MELTKKGMPLSRVWHRRARRGSSVVGRGGLGRTQVLGPSQLPCVQMRRFTMVPWGQHRVRGVRKRRAPLKMAGVGILLLKGKGTTLDLLEILLVRRS